MSDEPAATDETSKPPVSRARRRASRPAGTAGSAEATVLDVAIPSTASKTSSTESVTTKARPAIQAPRRQPHRSLVMTIGLAVVAVLVLVHELAEVFVIANGVRAGRATTLAPEADPPPAVPIAVPSHTAA